MKLLPFTVNATVLAIGIFGLVGIFFSGSIEGSIKVYGALDNETNSSMLTNSVAENNTGIANANLTEQPRVDVSPACGPAEPGFNIVINANGFKANSTVAYKFVGSDSKISLYGYFETNSTGGFNDVTFADDLKEDNYKLYFGDDANNDGALDIGAKRVYANVTIPCQ